MKIAIVGSGAMGSLMGAKLSKENDVLLFDHWADHVNIINKEGLKLNNYEKVETIKNIKATNSYLDLKNYDVYIILVKGINTLKEIKELKNIINENSLVVTLQNGLGNHYTISKYVNEENIAYGMMDFSARLESKGFLTYELAEAKIALTMFNDNNSHPLFKKLVETLENVGFNLIVENAKEAIWKKLVINANFNAISGITGLDIGTLVKSSNFRPIVEGITKEICLIANKKGINLVYEEEVENIFIRANKSSKHYPSLAQDVSRKNKTEIDYLNKAIVNEGKKLNIETPYNELVYNLVKLIENNYDLGKEFKI